MSEILKYQRKQQVTKSQETNHVVIQISKNEAFDKIILDRKEHAAVLNKTIATVSSELIKCPEEPWSDSRFKEYPNRNINGSSGSCSYTDA